MPYLAHSVCVSTVCGMCIGTFYKEIHGGHSEIEPCLQGKF